MSELRAFLRLVRARYQLARGFCGVPPFRALRRAVDGAVNETLCGLIVGHDFEWDDTGLTLGPCTYCDTPPTGAAR